MHDASFEQTVADHVDRTEFNPREFLPKESDLDLVLSKRVVEEEGAASIEVTEDQRQCSKADRAASGGTIDEDEVGRGRQERTKEAFVDVVASGRVPAYHLLTNLALS
jgi:hypothetical protein